MTLEEAVFSLDRYCRSAVYWVLPPLARQRHGITDRPGKWPEGTIIAAMCGERIKMPFASARTSISRDVPERCAACAAMVEELGSPASTWDY